MPKTGTPLSWALRKNWTSVSVQVAICPAGHDAPKVTIRSQPQTSGKATATPGVKKLSAGTTVSHVS